MLQSQNSIQQSQSKEMENSKKKKPISKASKHLREESYQEKKSRQISKLMNDHRRERLLFRIINYHGKNVPVNYKPEYQFLQQWQNKDISQKFNSNNLFEELGLLYYGFSLLTMVLSVFGIWVISIERYFQTREISLKGPTYELLIIVNIIDTIVNTNIKYKQNFICPEITDVLKSQFQNILLVIYFTVMLVVDINHIVMNLVEIVVMVILYKKAASIYGSIKVMEFGLQYQNSVKIFDLLFNVLIQAHIFAVLLFSASKINPENNWIKSIGAENQSTFAKYINSVYFACTTMLTIGYGDISPKNVEEKIVTIFIEIVGVIAFGYLLNEMGHTLSKMRKQSESIERDLQTIGKISKYYNLEPKLRNKARNFILNNQQNNEQLKIEDENRLLMKLNEDLRDEINLENSLNVVKSCIFFICHWTKNMQTQIAQRLEKRVFAPNQKLVSRTGHDRMYIIKKGKIAVSMKRYGSDQEHRKVLKVIDMSEKEQIEVCDNIYGYTLVFSNRPVKLQAIAKDFTSTYSIDREDIQYCINQNKKDFEYYHEVKCRIDQSTFCQEWQAPKVRNIRAHYCPSHICIFKKYKKELEDSRDTRKPIIRQTKKKFDMISPYFNVNSDRGITTEPEFCQRTIVFDKRNEDSEEEYSSIQAEEFSYEVLENKVETQNEIKNMRARFMSIIVEATQRKIQVQAEFQKFKEYTNFFPRNNLTQVLFSLQKENPMQKEYASKKK